MSEELFIDQPIKSSGDDLFGRKKFADALAKVIMNWDGKESLVIAISGNYGSGKTSLKNMMVEQLRNVNEKAPYLVEFNPWEWSKQDKLTEAFFREISLALGRVKSTKEYELSKTMERYGQTLTFSAEVISDFSNISSPVSLGAAVFGLFSYFTQEYPILSKYMAMIAFFLLAIMPFVGWLGRLLTKFGRFFGDTDEVSLEDQKTRLRNELKCLEKPILVTIDDIDRLDKEETQTLFRTLKVNADFPNFVYLLLYQREAVEKNLEDVQLNKGDFLTKAVHLPFDIPSIPELRVHKVLSDSLRDILGRIGINELDEKRWGNLFLGALKPYFNNLRSVKRFLSTFSLHVGLFKGIRTFEVNVIDLIGVETVRIFEPDLYQRLAQSKHLLTHLVPDGAGETEQEEVHLFLDLVDVSKKEYAQELIKQLFPPVERVFGGYTYRTEFYEKWREDLRICSDQIFDRYFQFGIQGEDLSESDLDELLDATTDREEFKSKFRTLVERGLQNITLSRLDDKKQKIPINNAPTFLPALFDLGDEIADNSSFMEISPPIYLLRIVWWYLMNEPSELKRCTLFCKAVTESGGLSLSARIIRNNMELRDENDTKPKQFLFDDNSLKEAKKLWLEKVRDIAKNTPQQLINITSLPLVLYFWSELGSKKETQEFISLVIKTDDGLLTFLRRMTQNVKSFTSGDYMSTQGVTIKLDEIEKFVSIDLIERQVNTLNLTTLSSQDKEIIDVFNEALKKRKLNS